MINFRTKKATDPKWIAGDEEHEAALAESGVSVEAAGRIRPRAIRWLVENIIPREAVTLIAGEPGAGKTFFACQLAADAARVLENRVVLATSGHEAPELLRWRLDQADGDPRRIAFATLTPDGFKDRRTNPTDEQIDERMSILYHTLEATGDQKSGILPSEGSGFRARGSGKAEGGEQGAAEQTAKTQDLRPKSHDLNPKSEIENPKSAAAELLIIDDVDGWFGKPGMMLPAAGLARVVQRLNELARELRVAIVVLVRTQPSVEGRITPRQLSRLSQAANVVWMVVKDKEGAKERGSEGATGEESAYSQSRRRWLLPVKNNLAPDSAAHGRTFEILDGQIRWHGGEAAPSLAEALLPSVHNTDRRRERRAAAAWIEEALAAGPLPPDELFRQGSENGYSKGTLRRAATDLGIHSHKTGFQGGWEMRWVPRPAREGRPVAKIAAPRFRIFEGDGEMSVASGPLPVAPSTDHGEDPKSSCASSLKRGESCAASCASSEATEADAAEAVQGQHLAERDGDATPGANASCAPSLKCAESAAASCAPSSETLPEMSVVSSPLSVATAQRAPRTTDNSENPKSEPDIYTVIVEALREASVREAG